jgi:hypothetical protein
MRVIQPAVDDRRLRDDRRRADTWTGGARSGKHLRRRHAADEGDSHEGRGKQTGWVHDEGEVRRKVAGRWPVKLSRGQQLLHRVIGVAVQQ